MFECGFKVVAVIVRYYEKQLAVRCRRRKGVAVIVVHKYYVVGLSGKRFVADFGYHFAGQQIKYLYASVKMRAAEGVDAAERSDTFPCRDNIRKRCFPKEPP